MPKPTIIELNGQKYDAVSGKKLAIAPGDQPITTPHSSAKPLPEKRRGMSVDGVAKPVNRNRMSRSTTHSLDGVATQTIPAATATVAQTKPKQTTKSMAISKFSMRKAQKIDAVSTQPKHTAAHPLKSAVARALPPKFAPKLTIPEPITRDHAIIQKGLEAAQSHTQEALPKESAFARFSKRIHVRQKVIVPSVTVVFVAIAGGVLVYNNIPNVALQVAAQRTGVRATMPAYSPNGFKLKQPIQYDNDEINIEYTSNSDDRSFKVTQKASSWDSRALLENFVAASQSQYQTMQIKGRTIYTYNNGDAAWVDGGTLYKIEGNSNLSSDQLLKIIDSL